jgi:DNA adenine methylase
LSLLHCNCLELYGNSSGLSRKRVAPHTLFYLDPPYYGTRDYNYNLQNEDSIELAEILSEIEGKYILSLGDHPEVSKIYKSFKMESLMTTYSKDKKLFF